MVEQKLLDYVRNAAEKGFSFEDVSKLLEKYGYKRRDIDEALWIVSREVTERKEVKGKKAKEKQLPKAAIEEKPLPAPKVGISPLPEMPKHIKPAKIKAIPEIEAKAEERIQQKFFPEKEKKKHLLRVIAEIIGGIILFAIVGILMYLFMWPALLNVR